MILKKVRDRMSAMGFLLRHPIISEFFLSFFSSNDLILYD